MSKFAGFSSVQLQRPQRSAFDLSHEKRLTTKMGFLTPVLMTECVPSDSFRGGSEILLRLAPLLAPIYDQIELYVHYYFVPNRLLWVEWEKFITGGRLGVGIDPINAPVPPRLNIGVEMAASLAIFEKGSLADYLGVPDLVAMDPVPANWNDRHLDLMPFVAYSLVWYEYYRDRNFIEDEVLTFPVSSGTVADAEKYMQLRVRAYAHDYFTSALPFTQRGEEVLMPLAGTGSVTYLDQSIARPSDGGLTHGGSLGTAAGISTSFIREGNIAGQDIRIENIDEVTLDASSVSINDFRSAYALQVWLERNAIGGSRYTESTQAHFGVKPQDSRLQRPEYIGGGRISVKISEVVSTAWSNDGTGEVPLANMAGHGVTYGNTNSFNYFCTEHGFIIGIASILSPASYQQGLPRMFKRRSFLDYPWPTFAKLGEQEVHQWEIYMNPTTFPISTVEDYPLFGYQSRYSDWKYICNTNHGNFKDLLLFWTLTRVFDDVPVLDEAFTAYDRTMADRIFAVQDGTDQFWMYIFNRVSVRRPLPYFGVPNTLNF